MGHFSPFSSWDPPYTSRWTMGVFSGSGKETKQLEWATNQEERKRRRSRQEREEYYEMREEPL